MFKPLMTAAALCLVPPAQATDLIGDTLTFLRAWPAPTTPYTVWNPVMVSTTVTADASDTIHWASSAPLTIDPGANQIVLTFGSHTSYGGAFDGFVITGFSHDIASASVLGETLPGTVSLQLLPRQLNLSIASSVSPGVNIVLGLSMVPEPAAWLLFAAGAAGLAGARRLQLRRG